MKLTVETQPAGASVFVGNETKPRCTTPCDVTEPRGDGSANLTIKLAGHTDAKRAVKLAADSRIDVQLAKRPVAKRPEPAKRRPGEVGDNTLNPFDD